MGRLGMAHNRSDGGQHAVTEMPDQPNLKTWRRWLRFSVRSLMIVVLISGCALGWIIHRARAQRTAVAAVRKVGGFASYDCEFGPGRASPVALSGWKKMIADSVGIDFVDNVVFVQIMEIGSEPSRRTALARLGDFEKVEGLNLAGASVTDDVLARLKGMNRLQWIMLSDTGMTDAGLVHLQGLTSLQSIYINGCDITDSGLGNLKTLTGLDCLVLFNTRITDAGLRHLLALPNLRTLALGGGNVTDAGVPTLKRLTGLKQLNLRGTKINTAGLAELQKALPNTRILQ